MRYLSNNMRGHMRDLWIATENSDLSPTRESQIKLQMFPIAFRSLGWRPIWRLYT